MILHGSFIVGLLVLQGFAVRVEHFEERDVAHRSFDFLYFRLHDFDATDRGPYIWIFLLDPEHEPLADVLGPYVVAGGVVLHWDIF